MKSLMLFLLAAILAACGQSETPPGSKRPAARTLTVEELASDPDRLRELRDQCRLDRASLGDVLCNRVAEATNRRFLGLHKKP